MAVSRARRRTKSTVAGSSMAGEVSGWQMMVVTPPAAAAWLADAKRFAMPGARLADEGAHVDQAGRNQLAAAVDDVGASGTPARRCPSWPRGWRHRRSGGRRENRDRATDRRPGHWRAGSAARRKSMRGLCGAASASESSVGQRRTAWSTAMRTATPISTCSRMTDCAPSATIESISTPRFIGPGCITSASGLA